MEKRLHVKPEILRIGFNIIGKCFQNQGVPVESGRVSSTIKTLIFFIPDANLTSIKWLAVPMLKHRIRTASSHWSVSVV